MRMTLLDVRVWEQNSNFPASKGPGELVWGLKAKSMGYLKLRLQLIWIGADPILLDQALRPDQGDILPQAQRISNPDIDNIGDAIPV